jgi:hypothetical protein
MTNLKKIVYFLNEVELIPPMTIDEFIQVYCKTHGVSLEQINERKKNYARDGFKNTEKIHISLCKFALYFFLYNRYALKYRETAEIINKVNPVRKETAFYYIAKAEDLLTISDVKFKEIYDKTIFNLCNYVNTRNKR